MRGPDDSGLIVPSASDLRLARVSGDERSEGQARAEAVLCDGDGIVVLATATRAAGREHTVLLRLTGGGEPVWRRDLDDEQGAGRAIAARAGGGFTVAGELQTGPLDFVGRLLTLDAGGQLVKARTLGEGGDTGLRAICSLGGGALIAGGARGGRGWLVGEGAEVTVADALELTSLAPARDGGVVAAGTRTRSTTSLGSGLLAGFGGNLSELWRRELPEGGGGELAAVAALPDGDLVAVGHHDQAGQELVWCLRIGAGGDTAWERTLSGFDGAPHRGRAVAVLPPGGDIAVAGDAAADGGRRMLVARLSGGGELLWERRFETSEEVVRGAAATSDGIVIVGSTTASGTGRTEVLVRSLAADGHERWTRVSG